MALVRGQQGGQPGRSIAFTALLQFLDVGPNVTFLEGGHGWGGVDRPLHHPARGGDWEEQIVWASGEALVKIG